MLEDFLRQLKGKSIHIVGITGSEGSNILRFLRKHNISNITAHDFIKENEIEKSFKLWHKGMQNEGRDKLFRQFLDDLKGVRFYSGDNYLRDILSADIIFIPQSWRLYKEINSPLFEAKKQGISFYSLTRLYLDFANAKVIGITGTVGKGSTANLLVNILKKNLSARRRIYFAGNETWILQIADRLDEMRRNDILVLEISHRQLQDGFTRAPKIVIFTNLYPNHLDEITWEEYKNLKLSLLAKQTRTDISVINYDIKELRKTAENLNSQVFFFSSKNKEVNIKSIQKIFEAFMNKNTVHYLGNILAASATSSLLGINVGQIIPFICKIKPLPARLELLATLSGIKFFDDIKSTTPWATIAAIEKLDKDIILICGGRTKGIDYKEFVKVIKEKVKYVIILDSELARILSDLLPSSLYKIGDDLKVGLKQAFKEANTGDNILISSAASFFYTDFIKGRQSLRKLVISLPQEGQSAKEKEQ